MAAPKKKKAPKQKPLSTDLWLFQFDTGEVYVGTDLGRVLIGYDNGGDCISVCSDVMQALTKVRTHPAGTIVRIPLGEPEVFNAEALANKLRRPKA
jgi:hypothetical protein